MRSVSVAAALAALTPFVSATVDIHSVRRVDSNAALQNTFIVELSKPSDLTGSHASKRSYSPHAALYQGLRKRGATWDVQQEYDESDIFVGAAVTLQDDSDLVALVDVEGVKAVHPVYLHDRPQPIDAHIPTGKGDSRLPPDTFSTHRMTGVDKVHAENILGKGIKVGIIDTGIDYTHPALGGGFGPGFKVYGGYDLVGDAYTGSNAPMPDPDPLDQCAGHGTHVAGIVGASLDKVYNFTGVAPEASLASYRVFGCKGQVGDDVLVDALTRAYKDGNDIITMSLGGAQGWSSTVTAVVASRIAKAGRVVTIAAGNDGNFGSWYSSSPGTAIDAFSVASIENTQTVVQTFTLSNGHAPIPYESFTPLKINGTLPIYIISNDTSITDDACNPLPASTPDLSNTVVLIKRGTCSFVQKLTNAAAKGMKQALIYDNAPGLSGGVEVGNFTAAIIQQDDGKYLVGEVSAGRPVLVTFPQTGASINLESPTGGLTSIFSTFGPTNDLFFKPSIAAPGGNILSTFPVPLGAYAILSGTSMATPFMAGSAALLLQFHNKKREVYHTARSLFETTAAAVASSKTGSDPGQTLAQTGAGLLNVHNAIHYQTVVSPAELLLNDTTHANMVHTIKVTNNHKTTQLYNVTHAPAGTAITMNNTQAIPFPVPLTKQFATMTSGARTLHMRPGETKEFTVKFTAPQGVDPKTFPVFSGNVLIESDIEVLAVSYLGVAAAMRDMQVLDTSSTYFGIPLPELLDSNSNPQNTTTTYNFNNATDFPTVVYRLVAGSPDVSLDLLDAKTSAVVGNLADTPYQSRNSNGDATTNGYNSLAWNNATFTNGTDVPSGSYTVKISALRITGDRSNPKDWDTWTSPEFNVIQAANATTTPAKPTSSTPSSVTSTSAIVTPVDTTAAQTSSISVAPAGPTHA